MTTTAGLNEYFERSETDGELLPVVDEHDNVLRLETRREIHRRGLLHRAVHVVLHDPTGRVVLQQRSQRKDHLPGWWDVSVGGHVGPSETYHTAAIREIEEEMGVLVTDPQWIGRLEPGIETGWEFIHIFAAEVREPVKPNPNEISDYAWFTFSEYCSRMASAGDDWRMSMAGDLSVRSFWARYNSDSP